jgi:hypothetical protein
MSAVLFLGIGCKQEFFNMKARLMIGLLSVLMGVTTFGETTKDGWFFAVTKEDARLAALAVGQPDVKEVLSKMQAAKRIYVMKGGIDIQITETDGGLVKFRQRGSIVEFWTCIEAINH